MFSEAEAFSLNFDEKEESSLEMAVPGEVHRDAILMFLERNNDPKMAAAFALETWIGRAAAPNERIKDRHVLEAVADILEARQSHDPLPEDRSEETKFVQDAAQDGLAVFASACANRLTAVTREAAVTAALQKALDSLELHRNPFNRRSYLDFIEPFIK